MPYYQTLLSVIFSFPSENFYSSLSCDAFHGLFSLVSNDGKCDGTFSLSPTSLAYLWMPWSSVSETWDSGMFPTISFSARSLSILISDKRDMLGVWVSKGCCGSPTNWVAYHSKDIHTLTVLGARSLKWRCQQGWFLWSSEGESVSCSFLPSFRCLQAILGLPHLFDASLQSPLCACFSEFPLLGKPPVVGLEPTLV